MNQQVSDAWRMFFFNLLLALIFYHQCSDIFICALRVIFVGTAYDRDIQMCCTVKKKKKKKSCHDE